MLALTLLYRDLNMCFRIVSRVIKKLCERICVVHSCLCFVIVNQLHMLICSP